MQGQQLGYNLQRESWKKPRKKRWKKPWKKTNGKHASRWLQDDFKMIQEVQNIPKSSMWQCVLILHHLAQLAAFWFTKCAMNLIAAVVTILSFLTARNCKKALKFTGESVSQVNRVTKHIIIICVFIMFHHQHGWSKHLNHPKNHRHLAPASCRLCGTAKSRAGSASRPPRALGEISALSGRHCRVYQGNFHNTDGTIWKYMKIDEK